ncbi:MAG: hypothetical protein ACE5D4_03495 [Thermodesulfobacteriota bacterium]
MAKPNYSYQKYQKELAKKKKQEEKKQRKLAKKSSKTTEDSELSPEEVKTD